MHNIFLGISYSFNADYLRKLFDIDPDHLENLSRIEQLFGCGYVEAGSYEIYSRGDYPNEEFDEKLIRDLLPFDLPENILVDIDFTKIQSFLYFKTPSLKVMKSEEIEFFATHKFEKFDFEY